MQHFPAYFALLMSGVLVLAFTGVEPVVVYAGYDQVARVSVRSFP